MNFDCFRIGSQIASAHLLESVGVSEAIDIIVSVCLPVPVLIGGLAQPDTGDFTCGLLALSSDFDRYC